ncbi:hypothetical protein Tco_0961497, partial [Tanacetum coccineum]
IFSYVEMDDANLTMEAYIKLEAEKARRRGQMFNWETATYRKVIYHENIGYFNDFETNFPAIVFDDALATDHKISFEPMVSPLDDNEIDFRISFDESDDEDYTFMYDKNLYSSKLIPVDNLKTDLENDSIRVNVSSGDIVIEQSKNGIDANVDTQSYVFDKDFEMIHDIHSEPFNMKDYIIMIKIRHHYHPELRGICGSDLRAREGKRQALIDRLRMVYTRAEGQDLFTIYAWRKRGTRMFGTRVIDMEELVRLPICDRLGDTWAWADPAPIQAPQAPPVAAPGPRTKPQSMAILKEEVHGLRDSLGEQRAVLDEMSRDFSRYHTKDAPDGGPMGPAPQQPRTLTTSPILNLSSLDTPGFTFLWTCLNTAYPGFGIRRIDFLTLLNENDDFGGVFVFWNSVCCSHSGVQTRFHNTQSVGIKSLLNAASITAALIDVKCCSVKVSAAVEFQ